jgi:periplasmic protein TonB
MQADKLEQLNVPKTNIYAFVPRSHNREIIAIQGQPRRLQKREINKNLQSSACLLLVTLAHVWVIYNLAKNTITPKYKVDQVRAMQVSLIAPPAPELELAPIVETTKPVIEPKPKLKKLVEKTMPVERPAERLIEAATQQPIVEEKPAAKIEPVQVSEISKAEPIVEDKIEPPRFGVAYLNNPAPEYPAMSRRAGEVGLVVMKVLVSSEGSADEVKIEKSSGFERLDNAAIDAVKKWRFIPAKKNHQSLSAYVLVPMKFSLEN